MLNRAPEGQQKIHIHCPYCWTEFHDFEQIGKGLDYHHHLFQDFVILPVEKATAFPHYLKNEPFGDNQFIEQILCAGCDREYAIIFLPWGIYPDLFDQSAKNKSDIATELTQHNYQKPGKNRSIHSIISNWKIFILFNFLLIFGFFGSLIIYDQIFSISFGLFLVSEIATLIILHFFSDLLTQYHEIENMPFLIHEKYLTSSHFKLFKQNFFDIEKTRKEIHRVALFLIGILSLIIISSYIISNLSSFMKIQNYYDALGSFLINFGAILFVLYFIIVFTMGGLFLIMLIKYLTFVSTKIPIKIDPWKNQQDFRKVIHLGLYSLLFALFLTIVCPIVLILPNILKALKSIPTQKEAINVFFEVVIKSNLSLYLFEGAIISILIIVILFSIDANVNRRKKELVHLIKKELNIIKSQNESSNHDIAKVPILLKECERIKEISSISWIDGIIAVIINLVLPTIFLIIGWVFK